MKNIAVFFGGQSVEHDVSVITGVLTLNALDKQRFNAVAVFIDRDGVFYTGEVLNDIDFYKAIDYKKLRRVSFLPSKNRIYAICGKRLKELCAISCAINCLHGERGEDGAIAGLLALTQIPFASPDMLASAVSIDKSFTKTALKGLHVKTVKGITVKSADAVENLKGLKFPLIVKPNKSGSSIGIERVDDGEGLFGAVSNALRYGDSAVIEPFLEGIIEINCAAYKRVNGEIVVSPCERPVSKDKFLSFNDKYKGGERIFPADIENQVAVEIQKITKKVYTGLNLRGVVRIDYMLYNDEIYVNEINAVPGSLAYYLFSDTLKGFSKILTELIAVAEKDYSANQTVIKSFKSGILTGIHGKGAKHL